MKRVLAALIIGLGLLVVAGGFGRRSEPSRRCRSCSCTASPARRQQYETQALRWASNDYPNVVTAIDRNSLSPADFTVLDAFFDDLMAQTGDDQIYVVGHSQGTSVMCGSTSTARPSGRQGWPSTSASTGWPARPARVASSAWACGRAAARPGSSGTTNVRPADQGHTQSVGSAESFAAQYEFFTGHAPRTTMVLPEPPGQVEIAGRAVNFPANAGLAGSTLDVYEVEPELRRTQRATRLDTRWRIGADGNFGPLEVNGKQALRAPGDPAERGWPAVPALLLRAVPAQQLPAPPQPLAARLGAVQAIDRGPHTSVSIVRQKEWWGNNTVDPANIDSLEITTRQRDGTSRRPATSSTPRPRRSRASTIAVITFDNNVDGVTDTERAGPARTVPLRRRRLHAGDGARPTARSRSATSSARRRGRRSSTRRTGRRRPGTA